MRVVKAIVDGARLSAIFKQNPMYFYHNCRKIKDLHELRASWNDMGEDFKPSDYVEESRRGYKKPRRSSDDVE